MWQFAYLVQSFEYFLNISICGNKAQIVIHDCRTWFKRYGCLEQELVVPHDDGFVFLLRPHVLRPGIHTVGHELIIFKFR